MAEVTPPLFVDVDSVYGADDLGLPYRDIVGEGVMGYEDLRVRQRGAGANMSVDVGAGTAWIMGDNSLQQPLYRAYNDATKNVTVTAAHATNPRIDMVIAEIRDAVFSGAFNDWRLRMVDGTASAGATLDNRTGAAALPSNSILLADVLVPALDTTVNDAEIRDRRPFGCRGVVPPILTDVDVVAFEAAPSVELITGGNSIQVPVNNCQAAVAMFLPRRVVSATRIRWRYAQGSTALTGNYNIGIYDASGRLIISTGSIAIAGAGSSFQERSETITATTFEVGWYYVAIGVASLATGAVGYWCANARLVVGWTGGAHYRNTSLSSGSGGITLPTTLLGMADAVAGTVATDRPGVPIIGLSVG